MLPLLLLGISQSPEVPAVVRASPYFTGAVADGALTVVTNSDLVAVELGGSVVWSVTLGGMRNPAEVRFPKFDWPAFRVEELPKRVTEAGVTFRWRLQPREAGACEIPAVRLDYYLPRAAETKRLRTQYTEAVMLKVTAPPELKLSVPERFLTDVAQADGWRPTWQWCAVPLIAAAVSLAAVLHWRWRHPDGVRLAKRLRDRSVRAVLQARTAEACQSALMLYLRERFQAEPGMTVTEMAARLPEEHRDEWHQLLTRSEAARFGDEDPTGWIAAARHLVSRTEPDT